MHRLCTSYSSYFNKKYGRVGHVFQGVFKCKNVLEDSYLTQLTGYIHLNPHKPFTWKYSSMPAYLGSSIDKLVDTEIFMEMHKLTPDNYKNFLQKQYSCEILDAANLLFPEEL